MVAGSPSSVEKTQQVVYYSYVQGYITAFWTGQGERKGAERKS